MPEPQEIAPPLVKIHRVKGMRFLVQINRQAAERTLAALTAQPRAAPAQVVEIRRKGDDDG